MRFRLLPWDYGIRNLLRRPLRTLLTFVALTIVIVLVLMVVGFLRGLDRSLAVSGEPDVVIVYSLGMGDNLEYSSIPMQRQALLTASLEGAREDLAGKWISPELFLGTQIGIGDDEAASMGLVRGVTPSVALVRRQVQIEQGDWPKPGEVIVGRLAAVKLGRSAEALAIGETVHFEDRSWRISGVFSARGSAFESEIWCRLNDLQQALKRQDLSLVALTLAPGAESADVETFCDKRKHLEMQAMPEMDYYAALQKDYRPVRELAWLVVVLVSSAGMLVGLNTMHGAVVGRAREFATLRTIGFPRRAILLSLLQENVILASAACLLASLLALALVNGTAIRFTMGAFALRIDNVAVLIGVGVGLSLGILGAFVPALRSLRISVVEGLKAV